MGSYSIGPSVTSILRLASRLQDPSMLCRTAEFPLFYDWEVYDRVDGPQFL